MFQVLGLVQIQARINFYHQNIKRKAWMENSLEAWVLFEIYLNIFQYHVLGPIS